MIARETTQQDGAPGYADLDGERLVLGQALIWPAVIAWAEGAGLRRGDFFRAWHARCWDALLEVAGQGRVPDVVSVREHWQRRISRDYPGDADFGELTVGVPQPGPDHVACWVRHLRRLAAQRKAASAAQKLAETLRADPTAMADGTFDLAMADLDSLRSQIVDDLAFTPAAIVGEIAQTLAMQREAVLQLGLTPELDYDLGAIAPGEVLGVLARPGVGKTLIMGHLIEHLASRSLGQMVFSAEMQAGEIGRRMAQRLFRLRRHAVEQQFREDTFDGVAFATALEGLRLDHTGGITVPEIKRRTEVVMRQQPVRVVLIDHLGRLGSENSRLSTYDRVSEQARQIKDLAKALRVAVVLLIQVSREGGGDGSRKLTLGSARESGVVEENCDYMLGLRRFDGSAWVSPEMRQAYRDVLFVSVLKNRHAAKQDREYAIRMDEYLRFSACDLQPLEEPMERGRR